MPVSPTRNTISVEFDGDVWRATLGGDVHTGVSSVATNPFDAMIATANKAREQNWAFDATHAKADAKADPAKPVPDHKAEAEKLFPAKPLEEMVKPAPAPVVPKPVPVPVPPKPAPAPTPGKPDAPTPPAAH